MRVHVRRELLVQRIAGVEHDHRAQMRNERVQHDERAEADGEHEQEICVVTAERIVDDEL